MINGETMLAVIPARSGSKRCAGKNFREFRGKRLVDWTLEQASNSAYIDKIILSTDADRPAELCTDAATCEDVLRYHLSNTAFRWIVLLQPTSPLRTTEDIDACIERAQMGYGCISVNRATGRTNGAVYVARRWWIEKHDFSYQELLKYIMPEERSLDINTAEDFEWDLDCRA